MRASRVSIVVVSVGLMVAIASGKDDRPLPARPSSAVRVIPNPAGPKFKLPAPLNAAATPTDANTAKWIVAIIVDASRKGTTLYNDGAHAPAFLYYEATLNSIFWFINENELRGRVQRAMYAAAGESWEQGAVVLRTALNDIRNRLDLQNGMERPLFDRLGGRSSVSAIVKYALDKAATKESKVNLDRNSEYPYTPGSDRAIRMQKATVLMIERLSDDQYEKVKQTKVPVATEVPKPMEQFAVLKDLRAKLNDQLLAAVKTLAELPPAVATTVKLHEDAKAAVVGLHKQIAAIDELLKPQGPALGAAKPRAAGVPPEDVAAAIKAAHKHLRITDDEFDAALKVFREALAQYAVPDQEIDELTAEVEGLRKSIVAGYSTTP